MQKIDGVLRGPFAPQSGPTPRCLPAEHLDDHDPELARLPPVLDGPESTPWERFGGSWGRWGRFPTLSPVRMIQGGVFPYETAPPAPDWP